MKNESSNIIKYFSITFLISWIAWAPFVLSGIGLYEMTDLLQSLMMPAIMIGAFSPMISAMILLYKKGKMESH